MLTSVSRQVYVYTLGTFVFYTLILVIVHRSYNWLNGCAADLSVLEIAQFLFGSLFNQGKRN